MKTQLLTILSGIGAVISGLALLALPGFKDSEHLTGPSTWQLSPRSESSHTTEHFRSFSGLARDKMVWNRKGWTLLGGQSVPILAPFHTVGLDCWGSFPFIVAGIHLEKPMGRRTLAFHVHAKFHGRWPWPSMPHMFESQSMFGIRPQGIMEPLWRHPKNSRQSPKWDGQFQKMVPQYLGPLKRVRFMDLGHYLKAQYGYRENQVDMIISIASNFRQPFPGRLAIIHRHPLLRGMTDGLGSALVFHQGVYYVEIFGNRSLNRLVQ